MSSASHPSTPYEIGQDCQPDGPEHDKADHHQGDPSRPSEVVYSRYDVSHCLAASEVAQSEVNVYNIYMAKLGRFVKGAGTSRLQHFARKEEGRSHHPLIWVGRPAPPVAPAGQALHSRMPRKRSALRRPARTVNKHVPPARERSSPWL